MMPLRSDTIWLVQNGCSFHGLRSKDPNQHLNDFIKLMDSLDLDIANRDFAKPVKAISLPHDVSSTSDRRLIELENQVQRLMEAQFAPKPPVQVNKIASSCEIGSGPYETQYCMEIPDQAFVDYASSLTDEEGDKWCTFKPEQNNLVKTLTVDEVEIPKSKEPKKAIEDEFKDLHLSLPVVEVLAHVPMYDALLDKYLESLEFGKNGSAFIHGEMQEKMKDPGLFILPCRLGDSNPFDTLADLGSYVNLIPSNLFKNLNIRLLEETEDVLGLADGTKLYRIEIVKNVDFHVGKLKLVEDFHVVDMEKDSTFPLLVGRGFLSTSSAVIDCMKAKIAVKEGITRSIFRVKNIDFGEENIPYWTTVGKRESYTPRTSMDRIGARPPYYAKKYFIDHQLPKEWEIARNAKLNPFKFI
ncbi:MAK10-like protein [Tanacetum coccineum]